MKEIALRTEIESGPTQHIHDRQRRLVHHVRPSGSVSTITISADDDKTELDNGIRRQWLDRQIREREAAARRGAICGVPVLRVRPGDPALRSSPTSRCRPRRTDLPRRSLFHERLDGNRRQAAIPRHVRSDRRTAPSCRPDDWIPFDISTAMASNSSPWGCMPRSAD